MCTVYGFCAKTSVLKASKIEHLNKFHAYVEGGQDRSLYWRIKPIRESIKGLEKNFGTQFQNGMKILLIYPDLFQNEPFHNTWKPVEFVLRASKKCCQVTKSGEWHQLSISVLILAKVLETLSFVLILGCITKQLQLLCMNTSSPSKSKHSKQEVYGNSVLRPYRWYAG